MMIMDAVSAESQATDCRLWQQHSVKAMRLSLSDIGRQAGNRGFQDGRQGWKTIGAAQLTSDVEQAPFIQKEQGCREKISLHPQSV